MQRQMSKIRVFEAADQELVRLLILKGLGEHWGSIDGSLNQDLNDIAASFAEGRTLVAQSEGLIVGTGTILPRQGNGAEIVRMSVAREARRFGVGQQLTSALLDVARGWKCERVIVETASHWTEVVAFYDRCGFRVTHEVEGEFCRDTFFEIFL